MITEHIFVKWALGPVGTFVFGAIWWGVKNVFAKLKTEWGKAVEVLNRLEKVQTIQVENCLSTIQKNGSATNDLLAQIHLEQAEMNGFLKGILGK
jgi:hypothetical protein